jgi:SNF2 family DNA or RNA helicase
VRCPLCRCPAKRSECISYAELKSAADETDGLGPVDETVVAVHSIRKHSSKTKEILNALSKIFGSEDTKDDKVVIFCSFVSYLSILAAALSSEGVAFASLTGSMTRVERARQMKSFSSDPSVRVILCSLKAAGVGITLTTGNHIFLTVRSRNLQPNYLPCLLVRHRTPDGI